MKKDTRTKLQIISTKLEEITRTDSDERIHIFTDQKELMELSAQINALLEKHQKIKVDYRRSLMASKKMLSNISHDIKTPMTVLLGYLELMRLQGASDEMLQKAEQKANPVMYYDSRGKCLGELDEIDLDNKIFYEDKTAKGLDVINPRTGEPIQTALEFALKQIYGKTKNRIINLFNSTGTRQAKKNKVDNVPDITEL